MSKTTIFSLSVLSLSMLCLLIASGPAAAQEEPIAGFEGLVEVTEVLLDVLATDRDGEAVTGLGKDDFIVEEDGEPVEVTGVSFYTTRYGDDSEPLSPGEMPSSRYFIFFFHDQMRAADPRNRLVRQQMQAARESREWVEEDMLPSDWVAVASYDVKLKVHQDFTQDRHAILQGIDNAGRNRDPEKNLGRHGREMPPSGAPSLLRHLPQGKELRKETRRIEDGLRLVAEASRYIVGRKNLMLFTIGFGEYRGNPIPQGDPRFYPQMEEALNDGNVAIYGIDLFPAEFVHGQVHFMNQLARATGGDYYENFVSFGTPLRLISEENSGYYMLSYQSEHPADESGYQEVKVRARDRSIKVRTRKGYLFGSAPGK